MSATQWAQREFEFAQLGDRRRSQRLMKIAAQLATRPGGTLPQALGTGRSSKRPTGFSMERG
jgi:hypothetical protein